MYVEVVTPNVVEDSASSLPGDGYVFQQDTGIISSLLKTPTLSGTSGLDSCGEVPMNVAGSKGFLHMAMSPSHFDSEDDGISVKPSSRSFTLFDWISRRTRRPDMSQSIMGKHDPSHEPISLSNISRPMNAYLSPIEEVLLQQQTNMELGLSKTEAFARRDLHGSNELIVKKKGAIYFKFLEQFRNPLILLLLLSASISLIMREYDNAFSITLAILIVVLVAFIQEWRSEKTLEALNKLVPHVSNCLRDGQLISLPASELVPGDIVKLSMGDRVPADIRLITAVELEIDESTLTGETKPVRKQTEIPLSTTTTMLSTMNPSSTGLSMLRPDEQKNMAFMGTLIRNGYGSGIVVAIGEHTEFGRVFRLMENVEERRTLLQTDMDRLGKQLSILSCAIIGCILLLGILQRRPLMNMFTIGVSLAVAAIPEGLPIVVTVTLALGVMRMARRHSIVKKLPSVEALGSVNVICADKTGTLTYNRMQVTKLYTMAEDVLFEIVHDSNGNLFILKHLSACHMDAYPSIRMLFLIGNLCNNSHVAGLEVHGQPTETALLAASLRLGMADQRPCYHRVSTIPFSSETRSMSVLCSPKSSTDGKEETLGEVSFFYVKGATEAIFPKCTHYFVDNDRTAPMTSEALRRATLVASEIANQGLRVLALAYGRSSSELIFVGLAGIHDPPRIGVADSIGKLTLAGVRVVMITGDSKETARSIAKQLHLSSILTNQAFMSGTEWDRMSETQRYAHVPNVYVFYRAEPRHKLSIVQAFQANGATVAMTGDGVNDAPALKCADIGIAMGITGTDVSKEAADMIILDDDFSTIVAAIEEGKSIFFNIKHFLRFQLSTSMAALALVALSTLYGLPTPLNAMQILWINIIMDGPPAQSLGVEPVDPDVMHQPPRNRSAPMITRSLIFRATFSALIIVCGTMHVFRSERNHEMMTARTTTMTFTTFVMFDMFNAISCRSDTKSVFTIGLFTNRMLWLAIGVSIIGQLLVIYVPFFQSIFQTEALAMPDLIYLSLLASSVWWIDEILKHCMRRYNIWKLRRRKEADIEIV
jgi:P-type Ca2+ transporter type 2C